MEAESRCGPIEAKFPIIGWQGNRFEIGVSRVDPYLLPRNPGSIQRHFNWLYDTSKRNSGSDANLYQSTGP